MPPNTSRRGGSFRLVLLALVVLALVLGGLLMLRMGSILSVEDPLPTQPADAILVLAGSEMTRPLEAVDLYRQGAAKLIVLTAEVPEPAVLLLKQRGVTYEPRVNHERDALVALGVPPDAVLIPPGVHDNTGDEARTLRALALSRQWRQVIVVTSKLHTRRAAFAMRQALKGTPVEIVMRGSRYDAADPGHWWRSRADVRFVVAEMPKLAAYLVGLGM